MEKFFKLKENNTTVRAEVIAGFTTFFAMSYIIFVNPLILSASGMPSQGVFVATCLSSAIATILIALIANVPYALAPGMGLNAYFTYTVVFALGFTWQEALALVFVCGVINILVTVTKFRQAIIKAIPESLQNAISGGIGIFIAYIGLKNANFIDFSVDPGSIVSINNKAYDVTQTAYEGGIFAVNANGNTNISLTTFTNPMTIVVLLGIILTVVLIVKKSKLAIILGILGTTAMAWVADPSILQNFSFESVSFGKTFSDFGQVFGVALGAEGLGKLLADPSRYPLILVTIFAFSITDVFDTIGVFIGTGKKSGIFSEEHEVVKEDGTVHNPKMERALFGDAIGTSIGAVLGTSNVTTYVESSAGIGAGGRTGLTSIVVAACFILSIFLAPIIGLIPGAATAPALIIVGIMMLSPFKEIEWEDMDEAIPAFFTSIFMGLVFSISYGIAFGFLAYIVVKTVKGKAKEVHPILWITVLLFIANFVILALV